MHPRLPTAAAAALFVASLTVPLHAQQTDQRVEITGSSIKRVQNEGATPLMTVSRAQIERLAVSSVGDLLNALPGMAGIEEGGFTLQPTLAGFQGAAMPGFGSADTLVLLNGRRLAKYPVGGDTVDLNGIPLSIVERVEILRDGASAIYGSDAIAGVVNLITRREYSGIGVQASFGETSRGDGRKQRGAVWGGFGDLQKQRWNVLFGLETEKVDPILDRDREITANADLRPYGLADDRLPTSPEPNVLLTVSNRWQPIAPCKPPLPPQGVAVANASPGLVCGFNPNSTTQLQPEVKSTSFFLGATLLLGESMQLKLEHFGKNKESGNYLNPQPIQNTVAADDPTNPYGEVVIWAFRSTDPRLFRRKNIEVESQRTMAELTGTLGAWDWSVDAGRGQGDYTEISSGYFINSLFVNAVRTGVVNPFAGRLNPDDLVPLTAAPVRTARTVVDFADAKISGSLLKLPAGEVAAAFGVSTFDENYRNTPDPLQAGGLLRGDPRLALVSAGRKAQAAFAEVAVPVFRGTELSAAVRHDRYSDFGNTTNGKLSLRLQPARALLIRASAGSGFRAPSLEALYATDITGFPLAIDFAGCAAAGTPRDQCTAKQIFTATTSNPNLKAEKSDAVTFGVVFEPFNGASMSLDWIQVKKQDAIEAFGLQTILDNPDAPVAGFGTARNLVRRLPNGQIDPDTSRPAVIAPTANLAKVDVESVDMNLRWAFAAGPIRWRLENTTSWLLSRTKEPLPGLAVQEFAGLAGFPQWRNAFSVNAIWGAFEATAFVRRVAGFDDITDPSARTAATRKVSSWSTTDLTLSHHGLVTKGTRIDFVVKNVADRMPPLSAALNTANKIDFNHSAVGRFFQVSLKLEY